MNISKKPFALCAAVALLLLTGCPEARFATSRTVALNFPASDRQSKVSLSVSNAEVQEALKVIDSVLTSEGFTRDANPATQNEQGALASYARYDGKGLRQVGTPDVYFKGDRLEVIFIELGNRSGHLTTATKKAVDSLRKELSNRYGAQRARVVNGD